MVDVKCLSDYELQGELKKLGFSPGPILQFNTTIVLKGNITLSTEKGKGPRKRPEAATRKPKALDCYGLDRKASKELRCATRSSKTRVREESVTKEKDCFKSQNLEGLPVAITFAVLAIFIIVVFIYITVERKPLFG
ncbi:LEM domain-containing protein 1 [Elephas maximus indicus]|uniref:LEM domain-containing protein 1 n=1 Tax=Elephas maximus indicus TaxID=99487 RepID=UPI00211620A0|nr:LEM domain-containing protein 1 [Elephas maximus indicus]